MFYSTLILFFFIHPPSSEIYTLSLHDALPILVLDGTRRLTFFTPLTMVCRWRAVQSFARLLPKNPSLDPRRCMISRLRHSEIYAMPASYARPQKAGMRGRLSLYKRPRE